MDLAPIAFFAFRRPKHALRGLTSLSQCELADRSSLHIFCDAVQNGRDAKLVQSVRDIVTSRRWCGDVTIAEQSTHMGLAKSIITGTTRLCAQYGKVIVLEDDLVMAPQFLRYMNAALERYRDEERVMHICGYMAPVRFSVPDDILFFPWAASWGWATWQRAWQYFDADATGYAALKNDAALRLEFDLGGAYPFFDMLAVQVAGKLDAWAARWQLSMFMRRGLALFPRQTMVQNIGLDGSGTHGTNTKLFVGPLAAQKIWQFPAEVRVDSRALAELTAFFREAQAKLNRPTCRRLAGQLLRRLKGALR